MRLMILSAISAFLVDQISKLIVVHGMDLKTVLSIDVLPPFLVFRMGWNTGVNFGLFGSNTDVMRWVLIAIAMVICGFVIRWVRVENGGPRMQIAAGLLIGGALANVLDRLIYGAVADFLNMSCCGIRNPFSFNLADVAIFAGAIGLIVFGEKRKTP